MSLHEVSIRRPVLAIVMSTVIVIFGLIGLRQLGVREFPEAERPIISVQANYPGANATVIESQITEVLEEEINTVSGIRTLTSVSREGRSSITVEFELGDDLDRAANDVRDRVASAIERLPDDADARQAHREYTRSLRRNRAPVQTYRCRRPSRWPYRRPGAGRNRPTGGQAHGAGPCSHPPRQCRPPPGASAGRETRAA